MPTKPATPLDLLPNPRQLGLLGLVLALGSIGALLARNSSTRVRAEDGLPVDRQRIARATERIDPNLASVASLRRLPNIGPLRAQKIVQYRQDHPPRPFRTASDLMKIHGIGLGTARMAAPHLALPDDLP
jgi:DNA uptake protein ComE-like DNA-binding protein